MDTNVVSYDTKPIQEYESFQQAYDYYNARLFSGALPDCLITLQRKRAARGYFWASIFTARSDDSTTDEIAMNPEHFGRSDAEILSTLVHEMCHLWQQHYGKPSRNAYHNREWARKMEQLGLIPSDTGAPGGKQTGQRVSHYIAEGGPFEHETAELLQAGFRLRWQSSGRTTNSGTVNKNKIKYTCPNCEQNAWAKPGARLICGDCMAPMTEEGI
jgi:predicted SprT family Zn-dependent metalloprotease